MTPATRRKTEKALIPSVMWSLMCFALVVHVKAQILPNELISQAADSPEYQQLLSSLRGMASSNDGSSSSLYVAQADAQPQVAETGMDAAQSNATAQPPKTVNALPIAMYGDLNCGLQDVVVATSTDEVAAAVKYYYSQVPSPWRPNGPAVKIRVATRIRSIPLSDNYRVVLGFGDRSGFACPTTTSNTTRTAVFATTEMRKVLKRQGERVTVQAGMTATELIAYANSQKLTVPLGTLPIFLDLTIGGLLTAGGHGQGPTGASALSDIVTSITFVDGKGNTRTVGRKTLLGRALAGGLGMLGIITEVTLQLKPGLTKTKVFSVGPKSDANIEQELSDLIETYSSRVFVRWRPDLQKYRYVVFQELPAATPSNPPEDPNTPTTGGILHPLSDSIIQQLGSGLVSMTFDQPSQAAADNICNLLGSFLLTLPFTLANGKDARDNATALTNNMQGSDCNVPGNPSAGTCLHDYRAFPRINTAEIKKGNPPTPSVSVEEAEFALPEKHLRDALADMKALGKLSGCWPAAILVIRPGGSVPDLISPASGNNTERFVWVELFQPRPNVMIPETQMRVQKKLSGLQEAFEQLMVCKYGARPHWGKSWGRVYSSKACPIRNLFPQMNVQLGLKKRYDPVKLFETAQMSTMIAGGQKPKLFPGCAIEMSCYCEADEHCGSPGKLFCKTAPAPLPPYKICLP